MPTNSFPMGVGGDTPQASWIRIKFGKASCETRPHPWPESHNDDGVGMLGVCWIRRLTPKREDTVANKNVGVCDEWCQKRVVKTLALSEPE